SFRYDSGGGHTTLLSRTEVEIRSGESTTKTIEDLTRMDSPDFRIFLINARSEVLILLGF
ncbi:MAG: hypothetical protein WCG04_03990, partial [Alphaproteobacteria bacterium]